MTTPTRPLDNAAGGGSQGRSPGRVILGLASILFWSSVWVLLRGSIAPPGLVVGLLVGTAVHFGVRAVFGAPPGVLKPAYVGRVVYRVLALVALFLRELIVSNIAQLRIVLAPKVRTNPTWLDFETTLRTEGGRALLGALISMTPGTLTASIEGQTLEVHFLDTVDPENERERIRHALEAPVEELERLLVGDLHPTSTDASMEGRSV